MDEIGKISQQAQRNDLALTCFMNILSWQKLLHSLTPTLDWPNILIGVGGLSLLGFDLLQSHFIFMGGAWEIINK